MNSAFLVFNLVGGDACFQFERHARRFVQPKLDDPEEALGFIFQRRALAGFRWVVVRQIRPLAYRHQVQGRTTVGVPQRIVYPACPNLLTFHQSLWYRLHGANELVNKSVYVHILDNVNFPLAQMGRKRI